VTATAITSLGEVTEVPEKAKRRRYTVEYKLQIVKEADACKAPGDIGATIGLKIEGWFMPIYESSEPNGPGCGDTCCGARAATIPIQL
jgi:hypothetical protein